MDKREELMLEKLEPKAHESAKIILATFKSIKEECKGRKCRECSFYEEKPFITECLICGRVLPEDWNEYEITERIFK